MVDEEFLNQIRKMKRNNKTVKICFGYHKTDYTINQIDKIVETDNFGNGKEEHTRAIQELKNVLEENLKYSPPLHSKILIVDDEFMVIGSYNWLSNYGKRVNVKDEIGCLIYDKQAIEFVNRRYGLKECREKSPFMIK